MRDREGTDRHGYRQKSLKRFRGDRPPKNHLGLNRIRLHPHSTAAGILAADISDCASWFRS
jgi:hypothetical protein